MGKCLRSVSGLAMVALSACGADQGGVLGTVGDRDGGGARDAALGSSGGSAGTAGTTSAGAGVGGTSSGGLAGAAATGAAPGRAGADASGGGTGGAGGASAGGSSPDASIDAPGPACGAGSCVSTRCAAWNCGAAVCCALADGSTCVHGTTVCPAGGGEATLACLGGTEDAYAFAKSCKTTNDCFIAQHSEGCCNVHAIGLNASEEARLASFEASCGAPPVCDCCCDRVTLDDGQVVSSGTALRVDCTAGLCRSSAP